MSQREELKEILGKELEKLVKYKKVEKILNNIKNTFDKEWENIEIFKQKNNFEAIENAIQNILVTIAIEQSDLEDFLKEWKKDGK